MLKAWIKNSKRKDEYKSLENFEEPFILSLCHHLLACDISELKINCMVEIIAVMPILVLLLRILLTIQNKDLSSICMNYIQTAL